MCDSRGNKNAYMQETTNCWTKSSPSNGTPPPMRQRNDKKQRQQNGFSSGGIAGFNLLPAHITPPSGLTKFIARNPFDADLTSRLHLSVISPTVFTKVSPTARRDSPAFAWSVDELALIHPAKIEEFPVQQMHSTDPDIEVVAQAAINKFFTDNQIIPSPLSNDKKERVDESNMSTPGRPLEDLNSTREIRRNRKDCWSQTVLTLPPLLPKEVEEALRPYLTFDRDQNVDNEDANSSNNSLRRKLFFNHEDDCTEEEEEEEEEESKESENREKEKSSSSFLRSELNESVLQSSPPQSGMLIHGTPLGIRSFGLQRTHGTPYAGNVSPPDMSPISTNDMSCRSGARSHCQLAARLDFTTEMSIDESMRREDDGLKRTADVELITAAADASSMIRSTRIDPAVPPVSREKMSGERDGSSVEAHNETAEMLSREGTPSSKREENISSLVSSFGRKENVELLKITSDWCKIYPNESYPRDNTMMLGNSCFGQRSYAHSAAGQDTGYQTHSASNITGNTDNLSISGINAKSFVWNDKILSNGEEIKLSDWKDNMKNMFSSTPSKYSRRKDN